MSEEIELYQEVLLEHSRKPRNFRELENPTCVAQGSNPLCGDNLELYVLLDGDVIKDISFQGSGCAISKASASIMGTLVKGKTAQKAEELFQTFHNLLTTNRQFDESFDDLGELAALSGVRAYPMRVKCAVLAWHALHSALEEGGGVITTEGSHDPRHSL